MRIVLATSLLSLFVAAPVALADGAHQLKPGQWEFQSSMEIEGIGAMPATTSSRCITEKEAKDPARAHKAPESCEMIDVKTEGNVVHWSVTCHINGGTQTGTGEMTFTQDTMKSNTTFTMNDARRGPRKMTNHSEARRVGECAAK